MDLSAVIFVMLALAWAGYLIPKALRHHDEAASDRLDEGHTERVRVLKRTRDREVTATAVPATPVAPRRQSPTVVAPPARTAARAAARRRRRVLAFLVLALLLTAGLAVTAYLPWWAAAVPAVLILLFLVVARLSVRRARRSSPARHRPAPEPVTPAVPAVEPTDLAPTSPEVAVPGPTPSDEEREQAEALAEDGSLWDPLPMTLPTYVNKARARRTVRTIELTGMQSSGHSEADTSLAREAEDQQATAVAATEPPARTAAGA